MEKIKALFEEYGTLAFVIYFTIFGLVLVGFFFSIVWASGTESTTGFGGSLFLAWASTKVTQLPRIGATLALTPIIGAALRKRKGSLEAQAEGRGKEAPPADGV
jgi:hypothetical protein